MEEKSNFFETETSWKHKNLTFVNFLFGNFNKNFDKLNTNF